MRRLLFALGFICSGCGVIGGAAAPTPAPAATAAPTVAATATRAAAPPTATAAPQPTSTPEPHSSDTVWVANTDGLGVYIRRTPVMTDRIRAYPDDTPLSIVGEDVDGDDQHWHHVKTPDGLEGYVPAQYTVDVQP